MKFDRCDTRVSSLVMRVLCLSSFVEIALHATNPHKISHILYPSGLQVRHLTEK